MPRSASLSLRCTTALAVAATFSAPVHTSAQESTSREVVQPLPSKDVQRLNRSLLRLAKRPDNVEALLDAGKAATAVGDLDAAIGFYSRADELSPNNAQVKLGMATVFMRSGRPVDALPLFNAAQSAGADAKDFLSDRALALDLVGDNSSAQTAYKRAIALNSGDIESKRRLAVSYAISGNRAGFEETLRPLLDRRDFASFRARAFGLAIMGEQDRAQAIVEAVMPRDLAGRITPYLSFMPRLTKSQQAAAANLGIFPRAADIGQEDARIAAYVAGTEAPTATVARSADSRLAPSGRPLGRSAVAANPNTGGAAQGAPTPQPQPQPQPSPSVAAAFAEFDEGGLPDAAAGSDAVNIAAIDVPRETAPDPEPAKPVHPSRIWVQVATGQDLDALKFDWRRMARAAPDLLGEFTPHVTPWGQANRLLAGPLASRNEARDLINALKEKGIDTFRFTSPEGTEIKELK